MILLLDNFDSFTFNLVDYFAQLGVECEVIRNNHTLDYFKNLDIEAVILSPGPGIPSTAGVLMDIVSTYHDKVPILGICLGHQAICEYFGWKLVKAEHPRHGKITSINCSANPLFNDIPKRFNVVQYNSLIAEEGSHEQLKAVAVSEFGHIMAVAHQTLPIWGVQFHPEAALTENGLQILKNWLECVQLKI